MVYIYNLNPVALSVAGFEIHWYGLMYLANFFLFAYLGWWLYQKYFKKNLTSACEGKQSCLSQKTKGKVIYNSLSWKTWENLVFGGFIAGILGGRLGFMLFYNLEAWLQQPLLVFKIWEGGMSIHGGVLGALIYGLIWCKIKQQPFWRLVDLFILPLCLALFVGRLTNFVNGELVGRINPTGWGVIFPHVDDAIRYPSQLFEAAKNLFMATIFWTLLRQSVVLKPGTFLGLFLIMYGLLRFVIEYFREPEIYVGLLTMGQILCSVMIVLGLSLLAYLYAPKRT